MSPVNSFYSYPAYEGVFIVDLNKDTKTTINKVPTGSGPYFRRYSLRKFSSSALG